MKQVLAMREYVVPIKAGLFGWEARVYDANEVDPLLAALRARVAEAVRMIEGYKRAGLLTNPAAAEQATDFISRATGNKTEVPK